MAEKGSPKNRFGDYTTAFKIRNLYILVSPILIKFKIASADMVFSREFEDWNST